MTNGPPKSLNPAKVIISDYTVLRTNICTYLLNRFTISDTLSHFCGEAFFRKSDEKFNQSWISEFLSKVFNRIPGFWRGLRNLPLTSQLCLVVAYCLAGEMCCHWQHCVLSLRSTSLPFLHLSVKQFKINFGKNLNKSVAVDCWR